MISFMIMSQSPYVEMIATYFDCLTIFLLLSIKRRTLDEDTIKLIWLTCSHIFYEMETDEFNYNTQIASPTYAHNIERKAPQRRVIPQ